MHKGSLVLFPVSVIIALAFVLWFFSPPVLAVVTTTITGWNFPNATTFNNGLGALIFPMVGMGIFVSIPVLLDRKGDFVVTMALLGMVIGSVFGMLTLAGSSGTVPFGILVTNALLFFIWVWKGGRG
ncbi:MAG: hypothetical protein KGH74_03510 [Candidatus Micrarchaeota archaeon]|nr:hypothetical protein [Candidatus Micrarchaeota archaeon]